MLRPEFTEWNQRLLRFSGIWLSFSAIFAAGVSTPLIAAEPNIASASELVDRSHVVQRVGPAGLKTFRWDFSRAGDRNFDDWPDQWVRHTGRGYPQYVQIGIQGRSPAWESDVLSIDTALVMRWPEWRRHLPMLPPLPPALSDYLVDRCLIIQLDGGLARVDSPPLPTSPTYQYQFSVDVQTEGLVHDSVFAEIAYFDKRGNELETRSTERVTKTRGWTKLSIDSLVPPPRAATMRVRLHVVGGEDGLEDIFGKIAFDNILLQQFPQLVLSTDDPFGVYKRGTPVIAETELLGLPEEHAKVRVQLLDHDGEILQSKSYEVTPPAPNDVVRSATAQSDPSQQVRFLWKMRDLPAGFYQLAARMESDRGASLASENSFVVVDDLLPRTANSAGDGGRNPAGTNHWRDDGNWPGEPIPIEAMRPDVIELNPLPFGWTLSESILRRHQRGEIDGRALSRWMSRVGVGWAKLPVWFAPDDHDAADAAAKLALRLIESDIQPVGMLDTPPKHRLDRYQIRDRKTIRVAALLRDASVWKDELETIMNRMTMRIRVWQIGGEDDHSFIGQTQLNTLINGIAEGLQGFGQPIDLVINWPWLEPMPDMQAESWRAVQRSNPTSLTPAELDAMLDAKMQRTDPVENASLESRSVEPPTSVAAQTADRFSANHNRRRQPGNREVWLSLQPLPTDRYARETRITDLVLRMATTRGHHVKTSFVPQPFDPRAGMLTSKGRPAEMLLPWRTTSLLLGRTRNAGSLSLQNRSHNILFRGPDQSVLMIWADSPRTESLLLGEQVTEVDVWGRQRPLPVRMEDGRRVHRVSVERVPKFLVGVDASLAEFRMSVALDRDRIDSVLGQAQTIGVRFKNPIAKPLQGRIFMMTPSTWSGIANSQSWELLPKQSTTSPFQIVLGNNATVGDYEVPIDFEFDTSPPTRIRVHRSLSVGPEGFDLEVTTRLVAGQMQVTMEMSNRTARPATFDCLLFAGGERQYERRVLALPPGGSIERVIRWDNGRQLIGSRMLLRAIEQNGDRVINHAFEVLP